MHSEFKKSINDYIEFFGLNAGKFITTNYLEGPGLYNDKGYIFFDTEHLNEKIKTFDIIDSVEGIDYSRINIARKSGKIRELNIPYKGLKYLQQFINKEILSHCEVSSYCHAYVKNRSILTNALNHCNKKLVICVDIKDFFNNFTLPQVTNVFLELGYNYTLASKLASLCVYKGALPIGAPTSPSLCNIIFKDYDLKIAELSSKYNLIYTRYADDLTFSTNAEDIEIQQFLNDISNLLKQWSFELNKNKTKIYSCKGKQEVTGLIVNDGVKVKSKIKKQVEKDIYYSTKYGVNAHLKNKYSNYGNFTDSKKNYIQCKFLMRLYGKINFIKMIEPLKGSKLESDFIYLFRLNYQSNHMKLRYFRNKKLFA